MNPIHAIFSSELSTLIAFLGPEFSTPTPKQNCNFGTLFFSGLSKSTYVIHLLPLARQQCQQIIRNQLIRNHEHIANITYSPSIIYSLGPETKLGIPTLVLTVGGGGIWQPDWQELVTISKLDHLIVREAMPMRSIGKGSLAVSWALDKQRGLMVRSVKRP